MSILKNQQNIQNQKTTDFRIKYKTQRCRLFYEQGYCPFNKFCAFAHNQQEIREKRQLNLKYKTKPCTNFYTYGSCKYGDRCQYLHNMNTKNSYQDKTRSDSEQTCSSKSSYQSNIKQYKNQKRNQFKYRVRVELLQNDSLQILDILAGNKSKFGSVMIENNENMIYSQNQFKPSYASKIINYSQTSPQVNQSNKIEYYHGLGSAYYEQKKLRMYSM